jgi:hypothetical protein
MATAAEFMSAPRMLAAIHVMAAVQKPRPKPTARDPISTVTKLIWAANQMVP